MSARNDTAMLPAPNVLHVGNALISACSDGALIVDNGSELVAIRGADNRAPLTPTEIHQIAAWLNREAIRRAKG